MLQILHQAEEIFFDVANDQLVLHAVALQITTLNRRKLMFQFNQTTQCKARLLATWK